MQVRVYNDNTVTYKEKFKSQEIVIEPNKFIEMDEYDAIAFLGQMPSYGIMVDGDGQPDKRYLKKLRIEAANHSQPIMTSQSDKHVMNLTCQKCKYKAANERDLDEHVTANHLHQLLEEEEVKKRTK